MKAFRTYLNASLVDRFCQILLISVLGGVTIKFFWTGLNDPLKCHALLEDGRWLDPGTEKNSSQLTFRKWQPPGCLMHRYTKEEIQDCFAGERLLFAGDSTSRQLFEATVRKMGYTLETVSKKMHKAFNKQSNMELVLGKATISFIWDPFLHTARLARELDRFRYEISNSKTKRSASMIFVRAPGLWLAHGGSPTGVQKFKDAIQRIVPHTDPQDTRYMGWEHESNLLLLSPVLLPYRGERAQEELMLAQSNKILEMNQYLRDFTSQRHLPLTWSFDAMIRGNYTQGAHDRGGLHIEPWVAEAQADVLLNARCNTKLARKENRHDRTCCVQYERPRVVQGLIFICTVGLLLFMAGKRIMSALTGRVLSLDSLWGLATILSVLSVCYVADRTHLFEVEQKFFSASIFGLPLLVVFLIGVASIQKMSDKPTEPLPDLFLSSQQADEFLGWIQASILLCDYTGASQSVEFYKLVRILISSYLFVTGYRFTLDLLEDFNFSLKKAIATLLRLNLMAVGLSYMMNTNYTHYHLPALLTFWYLVTLAIVRVGHENINPFFFVFKMIAVGSAASVFVLVPGVMEFVYSGLRLVFAMEWNITALRSRLSLDLYVVYVAMTMAFMRYGYRETALFQRGGLRLLLTVLSIALTVGYAFIARTPDNRDDYKMIHPYISWIPIFSLIMLRNVHHSIASYHSTIFAWLGRISVESYVIQFHLWLASDARGLLRVGVLHRAVEAAILTALFLWICWQTFHATQTVVGQIIGEEDHVEEPGYTLLGLQETDIEMSDGKAQDDVKECDDGQRIAHWSSRVLGNMWVRLLAITVIPWIANLIYAFQIPAI